MSLIRYGDCLRVPHTCSWIVLYHWPLYLICSSFTKSLFVYECKGPWMTRELFWVMGNPGISCCVENCGNESVSWKGKEEKAVLLCTVFSAVWPYCSSEKKGWKGIKLAVNLTGLHSRLGALVPLGCAPHSDKSLHASSERLFLHLYVWVLNIKMRSCFGVVSGADLKRWKKNLIVLAF